MPDHETRGARRRFLRTAVAGVIAAPIAGLLGGRAAAAEQPRLEESDPKAKAFNYVHDAADASDHSAFQEGAHCANCLQWTGGDKQWGGCNIFPGKLVNRDGWCVAWASKG